MTEYVEFIQPKVQSQAQLLNRLHQKPTPPHLRLVLQNISLGMLHQVGQLVWEVWDVN